MKGAGSEGQLLLSLGAAFKLRLYCCSLPAPAILYTAAATVPGLPLTLTATHCFGLLACPQTCLFTTALLGDHWTVSDPIPVSGPGPDPDLLLSTPARCWCSHCSFLPCYPAQLPDHLLLWSSQPSLPLAILSYALSP